MSEIVMFSKLNRSQFKGRNRVFDTAKREQSTRPPSQNVEPELENYSKKCDVTLDGEDLVRCELIMGSRLGALAGKWNETRR